MKPIFVDTSALIALGNKRDSFHQQAIKINNDSKKESIDHSVIIFSDFESET